MRRRSPYSLVDVKDVDVASLRRRLTEGRCIVGVDVAKAAHVACVQSAADAFERPWRVASPGQIGLLVDHLSLLAASRPVVVAMESSGTYGDALRQALSDAGIEVRRVSSKAVKDQAETFDGVPSQHDGKDAAIVADLCWRGKSVAWPWTAGDEPDQALRYWVRTLETAHRIQQVFLGRLEALLARHWPEVTGLLALTGATLAQALAHYGDPRALAQDEQAAARLGSWSRQALEATKIAAVIASAQTTVGVRMSQWQARELQDVSASILVQRRRLQQCRHALKALTKDHPVITAQAPVIGQMTACVLWMCLGDVRNYGSAAAYRKAMGLNLTERSSGKHRGQLRITKRGQSLTRKWLYLAALRWMSKPATKAWVARKKQRDGGKAMKAAVALMRRLALACWHVGQGEPFDAGRLFPGAAARVAGGADT